ncbi:MAG: pilus assembly protein [Sphingobium sp.]|nr:pilus assembly protein [Sphingobium sp.]
MRKSAYRTTITRLASDKRGATIIEFAFVAPVFLLIIMFLFDTAYYYYARAVLGGEVQAAGRSSTLETATDEAQTALDNHVTAVVQQVVPHGTVQFSRKSFRSYDQAATRAEPFKDANGNGTCDEGEFFEDTNGNGTRDLDIGSDGQGNARDVTIYTATLHYHRLFPIATMMGWSNDMSISESTILRNQPFDKQSAVKEGTCS